MPGDLQADVVVPIINFMYSGRLEFRPELHTRLYSTARQMNMTVLTKLLDAQALPVAQQPKPVPAKRISSLPVTWNLQGKKILPKQVDPDLPEPLPGRKLPIWKRRSAPPSVPSFFNEPVHINHHDGPSRVSLPKPDEVARPTRFEWPDDDFEPATFTSSFDDITYETKPLTRPLDVIRPAPPPPLPPTVPQHFKQECPNVSFEEIRRTAVSIKRPVVTNPDDNDSKKPKMMDLQAVKEYVEEHRLRKDLLDSEENSEDVDDDMAVADMDDDDDDLEDENDTPQGVLSGPAPVPPPSVVSMSPTIPPIITPQKSILKTQTFHEESPSVNAPAQVPSKKVRFTIDPKLMDGKENATKEPIPVATTKPLPSRMSNVTSAATANTGNLSNHAKIITEVLKKYPHLVQNNKNIRLKIMQRGGQTSAPTITTDLEGNKIVKSKVSYLVLKSEVANKGKPAVVLKHGGHVEALSELGGSQKTVSGAENITGPWLCHSCGTNEEPINFETYYQYRRHLQDVHMEKIDARICEHCGHRASKRNLLLYHLYTRHNIPPPRNCQFPKCDQCDYVALSESLLIKHRNNHSNNKEFVCKVCNAAFKSNGALQGHMQTNLHSDPAKKLYECPFCLKPFVRNINLKAHLRTAHKDLTKKLDEETRNRLENQHLQMNLQDSEDGEELHTRGIVSNHMGVGAVASVMEVPVINAVPQPKTEAGSVVLAPGMTVLAQAPTVQTGITSSEAEAFHNVAHGIAASLGLENALTEQTVILLDENQEYVFHTTEVVREETASTEIQEYVEETAVQEYIVPEIIGSEVQSYTSEDQTYTSEEQSYASEEQIYTSEEQTYVREEQSFSSENQSYIGHLPSNLEHYSRETQDEPSPDSPPESKKCALANSQSVTPSPSSLNIVPESDDVALVLSDHDYAEDVTQKEQCGTEGMMFIITQPMMDGTTVSRVIQQSGHGLPSLQMENVTVVEGNGSSMHSNILIPQVVEETQYIVENQLNTIAQDDQSPIKNKEQHSERQDTGVQLIAGINTTANEEVQTVEPEVSVPSPVRTYSPTKKVIPVSAPVRGIPMEQMADLVKEWDEFDEDSSEEMHSSPTLARIETG
ncbi:centrosome-associated zinc finger protein Cp190 isoform X2 [Anabrus simplex]